MFNPSSPVTGAAVTGLTTPTYTLTQMQAPVPNGKQYAITAVGGTQTGVEVNSISKPFTVTMFVPASPRGLPAASPTTGVIRDIPVNTSKLLFRKGAQPAANQAAQLNSIEVRINVAAGVDVYEPEEVKALISLAGGLLFANAAGIEETVRTGAL